MQSLNLAFPKGPSSLGWLTAPTVGRGIDTSDASLPPWYVGELYGNWPYGLAWCVVTANSQGPEPIGAGVLLGNMQIHVDVGDGQGWRLWQTLTTPLGGVDHSVDFTTTQAASLSNFVGPYLKVTPTPGYAVETWGARILLPVGFTAIAAAVWAKLDGTLTRGSGLVVQCGIDYYPFLEGSVPGVVPGVGTGRIMPVTNNWTCMTMTVGNANGVCYNSNPPS